MESSMINQATTLHGCIALFNRTVPEIEQLTKQYIGDFKNDIEAICSIPADKRTYANTFGALDSAVALSNFAVWTNICSMLESVHPDKQIQEAAHSALVLLQSAFVDTVSQNKQLYAACQEYVQYTMKDEVLSDAQKYFIHDTMQSFERAGLQKSDEELKEIGALQKEIMELGLIFDRNIAQDKTQLEVSADELAGVPDYFIAGLDKTENGLYILRLDYPTRDTLFQKCTNGDLRKRYFFAYSNQAYPVNESVLHTLIQKRTQLAQKLDFATFADYDLADQMAKTPNTVYTFLQEIKERVAKKVEQEYPLLISVEHPSITKTDDGKIAPWDLAFLNAQYRLQHYNVDPEEIAQYFPLDTTIEELLKLYSEFLGLNFKAVTTENIWHPDARAMQVFDAQNNLLGTLFVDLFPRQGKFTHACCGSVVPAYITPDGKRHPGCAIVIANFPKPSASRPSLLKLADVRTFFHEFGHALHALLGATTIASLSGTNTKRDFVELPSQLLEEWLWDHAILKRISCHYITKQPLPDDLIERIIALKQFGTGFFFQRQLSLALAALTLYQSPELADIYTTFKELNEQILTRVGFMPDTHMYANFGHLYGYGAKYYGYLWSEVFALDLFDHIERHGLTDAAIGKEYIDKVLAPGGTKDPNQLLVDFLGRAPTTDAFFKHLGL